MTWNLEDDGELGNSSFYKESDTTLYVEQTTLQLTVLRNATIHRFMH